MAWTQEQNTGAAGAVFRGVWFKDNLFAFVQQPLAGAGGVWQRDGIGPWVLTQAGVHPAYWKADGAFYTANIGVAALRRQVFRSVDGINWVLDWTLPGGWVANPSHIYGMEAYGDYLYAFVNDVGVDATIIRRDRAGVWTDLPTGLAPELTPESTRGVIEFGGIRYWTDTGFVRYWDGAAWIAEPTLDGQCGSSSWMSIIDNILYIGAGSAYAHGGGYFWKTSPVTNWSFLSLPIPDNTWTVNPLCLGGDGEIYTVADDGTDLRIYRKDGPGFTLVSYETGLAIGIPSGVGVEPNGTMYYGTDTAANVRFFAWAGVYDLTPGGLYPQAMDCDGDGDTLYLGLYDTAAAQPILVSVALPLDGATSIGSAVFNPGAGTRINVQCAVVGDNLVVAGDFAGGGGNEQVESSDDAGITWTDIDRDAWGVEIAQPLEINPASIDEVMVCLDGATDITETFDAGATAWIVNNAAIGYSPGAMALLPNGDEMIIGDDAANRIDYSPNRGVTLTNITGAFAGGGNVAALEIT